MMAVEQRAEVSERSAALWKAGYPKPHGPEHDCFFCTEMRAENGLEPLPVTIIGNIRMPSLKVGGRR